MVNEQFEYCSSEGIQNDTQHFGGLCSQLQTILQPGSKLKSLSREIEFYLLKAKNNLCSYSGTGLHLSFQDRHYRRKMREIAIFNLRCLKAYFSSGSDVLVTATHLLDSFLCKVKVQSKYMSCLTAACYQLASKLHASTDETPSPEEFTRLHKKAWSTADLERMEKKVSEKVGGTDSSIVTSLTFLRTFYQLMYSVDSQIHTQCPWETLLVKIEACLSSHQFNLFRPCTLALSLLDVVLHELCSRINAKEVVSVIFGLQSFCQISDAELYECNEAVMTMLRNYEDGQRIGVWNRKNVKRKCRPVLSRSCLPAIPEETII